MAYGAPDHHLPIEKQLDDLSDHLDTLVATLVVDIGSIIDDLETFIATQTTLLLAGFTTLNTSVNALKTTLTNLNIMPPVVETPWAFKLIGKSSISRVTDFTIPAGDDHNFDRTGSGQVQAWWMRFFCTDILGRQHARIEIRVDDVLVGTGDAHEYFLHIPDTLIWNMGDGGVFVNSGSHFGFYYNTPIMYTTSIEIKVFNRAAIADTVVNWNIAYTNLPT